MTFPMPSALKAQPKTASPLHDLSNAFGIKSSTKNCIPTASPLQLLVKLLPPVGWKKGYPH
jgi:hypothetical protein